MRPCDCELRPDYFDIHPDALEAFLESFDRITSERLDIYHLYQCPACRTFWIVDDISRGPIAVRAASPFEIKSFDDRPYRRDLAITMHGGLSGEKCKFAGCKNSAMKGIVFCVDHQYPQYAADDSTAG
jgi:hypothetical protein